MKNKAILLAGLFMSLCLLPGSTWAQGQTSSATLAVTAELLGSIVS
jgi:hypothetical protein